MELVFYVAGHNTLERYNVVVQVQFATSNAKLAKGLRFRSSRILKKPQIWVKTSLPSRNQTFALAVKNYAKVYNKVSSLGQFTPFPYLVLNFVWDCRETAIFYDKLTLN